MRKSEILFLLIGNNPLPNYVAAKLLAKNLDGLNKPVLCLIHSKDTEPYAINLQNVLGKDNFHFLFGEVNPWDFSSIQKKVNEGIEAVRNLSTNNPDLKFSVGLNYTGGTKAMSVHAYRAIKTLENDGFKVHYSYLDSNDKSMRFDVEDGSQNNPIPLNNPTTPEFKRTKISLDDLLALHGFQKKGNPITKVTTNFNPKALPSVLKDYELEQYVFQVVDSLKTQCGLDYVCSNLDIINPDVSKTSAYCEIDVIAIRGYQLFAISCTTAKIDEQIIKLKKCPNCQEELNVNLVKKCKDDIKHILTHKLFQVAIRAKELGGGEAKTAFVCRADSVKTKDLNLKLSKDNVRVFGNDDLKDLERNLEDWFKGN